MKMKEIAEDFKLNAKSAVAHRIAGAALGAVLIASSLFAPFAAAPAEAQSAPDGKAYMIPGDPGSPPNIMKVGVWDRESLLTCTVMEIAPGSYMEIGGYELFSPVKNGEQVVVKKTRAGTIVQRAQKDEIMKHEGARDFHEYEKNLTQTYLESQVPPELQPYLEKGKAVSSKFCQLLANRATSAHLPRP